MKWLNDIDTLEELRKIYRRLVIKYHPDNGGSDETIKEINVEYDMLFQKLKDRYERSESYNHTTDRQKQAYDFAKDQKIREMIFLLSKYQGLVIELCGVWLWVSGDTRRYRKELKALGLHYASQKQCWYIHWDDFVKHGSRPSSMSYIRSKYGSVIIHGEQEINKQIQG